MKDTRKVFIGGMVVGMGVAAMLAILVEFGMWMLWAQHVISAASL